jgi:hypothetical protein
MSSLHELVDYAKDKRISLEGKFLYLARPYEGEEIDHTTPATGQSKLTKPNCAIPSVSCSANFYRIVYSGLKKSARPKGHTMAPENLQRYSPFVDLVARFIIGTLGGSALIVLMVIMALDSSLNKCLIVVTVSLVVFALVVGLVVETDNKDTIVAAATYAAVLVVFVGNSGGGGGGVKASDRC